MACDNSYYFRSGVVPLAFYRMLRNERGYHQSAKTLESRPMSGPNPVDSTNDSKVTEIHLRAHRR